MSHRTNVFIGVTLILAGIRFLARGYLDTILSGTQAASLFHLLASGIIPRWRVAMLVQYRQVGRRK